MDPRGEKTDLTNRLNAAISKWGSATTPSHRCELPNPTRPETLEQKSERIKIGINKLIIEGMGFSNCNRRVIF